MKNIVSMNQIQTENTFGFKWKKRETYESPAVQAEWKRWLLEKYFDGDIERLNDLLNSGGTKKVILDAGCGSGGSGFLLFGDRLKEHDYLGVDISDAVLVAEERFREHGVPGRFIKSDLNNIPNECGPFDVIFSEGVLHHTDSVEEAIIRLSNRLKEGGKFLFYVYVKKSPIREYTDDLVRSAISDLSNDEAWEAIMPLTKFGKILGDLNLEIDVPDDIPFLGIKKGKHNLQRLFYYNVCKSYYRPDYSLEEMNHINFDWFRPFNCYRHTPEDIRAFCDHAGLKIERLNVEEAGITVIASK